MTSGFMSDTVGIRLAKIARRMPDNVAIVERAAKITFAQLDAEATAIAWQS